ncbi:MAG: O-antigen ligase family protein [Actinobacteria bacterium]|nr:O-antigen ligase family protein [Actinomycetota bacterium]
MTFPRPTSDTVAAIRAFLADPRFASASTLAAVGMAVSAQLIQNLIGWPGLVAILITLVVLMSGSLLARRDDIEWQGLLPVSLLMFVGLATISLLWSEYQWASLGGVAYLLAFTILGISVALTRDTIQIVRAYGDVFRLVLGVSIALEIVSGLLIDTPIPFLGVEGRLAELGPIQGIMGSRNQFGLVALLALITFGVEFVTKSVSRRTAVASLVLAAGSVLLSRSPVMLAVVLVVAAAAGALALLRRVGPERRRIGQLGVLAAAVVAAIVVWFARARVIELFSANSELGYRLTLWRGVLDLISRNPLEGWGWIGYWRPDVQPFPVFAIAGQREPNSALNAYLDVWFQLGLIGLLLFLGLVVLTFTRSWLLAGQRRSLIFAWPALVLVALLSASLAESSMLVEYGWMTFVVCSVKAARELSWRRAFARTDLDTA